MKRGDPQGLLDSLTPIGGSPPDDCVACDRELKKKSDLPVRVAGINGLVPFALNSKPLQSVRYAVSATACHEAAASSCGKNSGAR